MQPAAWRRRRPRRTPGEAGAARRPPRARAETSQNGTGRQAQLIAAHRGDRARGCGPHDPQGSQRGPPGRQGGPGRPAHVVRRVLSRASTTCSRGARARPARAPRPDRLGRGPARAARTVAAASAATRADAAATRLREWGDRRREWRARRGRGGALGAGAAGWIADQIMTEELAHALALTSAGCTAGRAPSRATEGGPGRGSSDWAAVFNALSLDLGGFRERIHPGAVARAFAERSTCAPLSITTRPHHRPPSAGKYALRDEAKRASGRDHAAGDAYAADVLESIRAATSTACRSRSARSRRTGTWMDGAAAPGIARRRLHEVSVVALPAYPATEWTSPSARSPPSRPSLRLPAEPGRAQESPPATRRHTFSLTSTAPC